MMLVSSYAAARLLWCSPQAGCCKNSQTCASRRKFFEAPIVLPQGLLWLHSQKEIVQVANLRLFSSSNWQASFMPEGAVTFEQRPQVSTAKLNLGSG